MLHRFFTLLNKKLDKAIATEDAKYVAVAKHVQEIQSRPVEPLIVEDFDVKTQRIIKEQAEDAERKKKAMAHLESLIAEHQADCEVDHNIPVACPKCNGWGIIDAYEHIEKGRCFRCNGTGLI